MAAQRAARYMQPRFRTARLRRPPDLATDSIDRYVGTTISATYFGSA
jgi:hypothetical protein